MIDVSANFKDMRESVDIGRIAFCENISDDGSFIERADTRYASGDAILIYYDITNIALQCSDEGHEVWLEHSIDILDEAGESVFYDLEPGKFHEVDETSAYFEITTERAVMPVIDPLLCLAVVLFVGYFVKRRKRSV